MSQGIEGAEPRFLPEVEEALRRAGWYPGRIVEEEVLEKWYAFRREEAPGYNLIYPAAYRFLREFGGLTLKDYIVDPLETVGIQEDKLVYSVWQVETHFYPLGVSDSGVVLHIDIQGRLWGLPVPVLLGNNTEEALTNLLIPGRFWSHPPKQIERKPIDQATEELINRIVRAEQKVAPSQALTLRTPMNEDKV